MKYKKLNLYNYYHQREKNEIFKITELIYDLKINLYKRNNNIYQYGCE